MNRPGARVVGLLALLWSCGEPATVLQLVIDVDPVIRPRMRGIRVQVFNPATGLVVSDQHLFAVTPGWQYPFSLNIIPRAARGNVRIDVAGFDGSGAPMAGMDGFVRSRALVAYQEGEARIVPMVLWGRCADRATPCAPGDTCNASGACESAVRETLPFGAGLSGACPMGQVRSGRECLGPPMDGGMPDAGRPVDATGSDATPEAAIDTGADTGTDTGRADTGTDAGADTGRADAGSDLGSVDTGVDVGTDLGSDAGRTDAGTDLGVDAGRTDTGTDTGADVSVPPSCRSGLEPCGGVCVDRSTDESHCGACGVACRTTAPDRQVCVAGACRYARSCQELHTAVPTVGSGIFLIQPPERGSPDAGLTPPFTTYCDMVADGGGWTFAISVNGFTSAFGHSATTVWSPYTTGTPPWNTELPFQGGALASRLNQAYGTVVGQDLWIVGDATVGATYGAASNGAARFTKVDNATLAHTIGNGNTSALNPTTLPLVAGFAALLGTATPRPSLDTNPTCSAGSINSVFSATGLGQDFRLGLNGRLTGGAVGACSNRYGTISLGSGAFHCAAFTAAAPTSAGYLEVDPSVCTITRQIPMMFWVFIREPL